MSVDGNVGCDGRVWFVLSRLCWVLWLSSTTELHYTSCNTDMDSVNNELSCAFHSKLVFSPGFQLVYVTSIIHCEEIHVIHHSSEFIVKFPVKNP